MALIISDVLRSFFELIYPIITLSSGDLGESAKYVQVSGFFTAYFFEASDFMVFVIAVHTAVYVFNPKLTQSADEGGLWRWRYWVFLTWVTLPALLAGLAFIDSPAYVPLVTWCYLPAYPLVWRYTLSWGPRYFILLLITVLYVALYVHVKRAYRTLDKNQPGPRGESSDSDSQHTPSPHTSRDSPEAPNTLQFPQPAPSAANPPSIPPVIPEGPSEKDYSPTGSIPDSQTDDTPTSQSFMIQRPPATPETPNSAPQQASPDRDMSTTTTLHDALPPTLRNNSLQGRNITDDFARRRARVERQMRTLFIFPVVYLIMWIPPFVNHLYQIITYASTETTLPPGTFAVAVLATVFLPSQGYVNVLVYAIRERPWQKSKRKYSQRTATSTSSASRERSHEDKEAQRANVDTLQNQIDEAKRKQLEIRDPAQAAYARREIERQERQLARAQGAPKARRNNWWDDINVADRV